VVLAGLEVRRHGGVSLPDLRCVLRAVLGGTLDQSLDRVASELGVLAGKFPVAGADQLEHVGVRAARSGQQVQG
jgi:hypothetical protein